jgi:hypothetical protein
MGQRKQAKANPKIGDDGLQLFFTFYDQMTVVSLKFRLLWITIASPSHFYHIYSKAIFLCQSTREAKSNSSSSEQITSLPLSTYSRP